MIHSSLQMSETTSLFLGFYYLQFYWNAIQAFFLISILLCFPEYLFMLYILYSLVYFS